jgi:tetratricopeptide (TPR) repeat protein
LRGRYLWFNENYDRSQEYFERAVQLQSDYAAAWTGLADAYAVRAVAGGSSAQEVRGKAEAAARKAVELDDSLPEAHNSMAALSFFLDWDWKRADAESVRAIELNPNYAEARHVHSYILTVLNRPGEGLQEQRRSSEIDPFARPWALGCVLIRLRQYDAAVAELRVRAEAQPDNSDVHFFLSEAYGFEGMAKESAQELEKGVRLVSDEKSAAAVRRAFDRGGGKAVAEWGLNDVKARARKGYVSPMEFASAYSFLGRKEETLKYLEDAYRERSPQLVFLQNQSAFDFLHSEERYRAIVTKMGLPPMY